MYINIINDKCPITFVKTKLALDKLKKGEVLTVHIKKGEALESMPLSLKELGYEIIKKESIGKNNYSLQIREIT